MKALAHLCMQLYPKAWRDRYGDEMRAVLDVHRLTFRTLLDLVLRAIHTQLFWERRRVWRTQFAAGALVLTFVCMAAYVGVQQSLRSLANEPQRTIVSSITQGLENGQSLSGLLPATVVDVKHNLHPFVIVYNQNGVPISSTVRLNGQTPQLPRGVLNYTLQHGPDVLTWQPQPDARIAAVVEHYNAAGGGYVLSGRALRVVENNETYALYIAEMVWGALLVSFCLLLTYYRRRVKMKSVH